MNIQLQEIKNMYIKNRLTEGVDFVRKEWLKGNGTAYINTMIPPTSNDVLRAVGIIVSKPTYTNIGFISSYDREYFRFIGSGGAYYKGVSTQFIIENLEIGQPESYIAPELDGIQYAMNNTDFDFSVTFKVNKVPTYTISSSKGLFTLSTLRLDLMATNFPTSTYLIGRSYSPYVGLDTCKLSDVYINSHHFVPCQLLKSIPSSLDANNIARQAGECGMYDSISGKFYGNVANSGTFTVEGDVEPETHTGLQQIYQKILTHNAKKE